MPSESTVPAKITAWQLPQRGLLSTALRKSDDVRLPELKADQVLVKVHAAALNPVDWKLALMLPGFLQKLPRSPGSDLSGEVVSVSPAGGKDIQRKPWLRPGARVYGLLPADKIIRSGHGSLATYAVVDAKLLGQIPDQWSYEEAAGITLVGLTAAVLAEKVKKGDKVLVLGASTAVGLVLTQMCKAQGASKMVATASGDKAEVVKQRGVDETVDHRATDAKKELQRRYGSEPFDLVLDCVGSMDVYFASPAFLKPKGTFFNIGASALDAEKPVSSAVGFVRDQLRGLALPTWLGGTPRKYVVTGLKDDVMPQLEGFVSRGDITPRVDRVFSFDEAPKAYEHLLRGRSVGKVVVKVVE